jgi:hypothetical protein
VWGIQHIWERGEVLVEKPLEERWHGDLGVDGRIILKWIFKMWFGEACTGLPG